MDNFCFKVGWNSPAGQSTWLKVESHSSLVTLAGTAQQAQQPNNLAESQATGNLCEHVILGWTLQEARFNLQDVPQARFVALARLCYPRKQYLCGPHQISAFIHVTCACSWQVTP
eukprot:1154720-Pelagomonas_calceolata.AAC.1